MKKSDRNFPHERMLVTVRKRVLHSGLSVRPVAFVQQPVDLSHSTQHVVGAGLSYPFNLPLGFVIGALAPHSL